MRDRPPSMSGLFEGDFPPATPIKSVSVVRICATRDEFSSYGQTRPGVAGYFNPGSEELVLFFEKGQLEETFGVMTHEAFHLEPLRDLLQVAEAVRVLGRAGRSEDR